MKTNEQTAFIGPKGLKPCPLCGGPASVFEYTAGVFWTTPTVEATRIGCGRCGLEIRGDGAAEAWNTRAEPRTCATCYYYQTIHERGRRTQRKACFGEHLHAAVGGLDWEDEAQCYATMPPDGFCSEWTPKDVRKA